MSDDTLTNNICLFLTNSSIIHILHIMTQIDSTDKYGTIYLKECKYISIKLVNSVSQLYHFSIKIS